jgi:hypothetical protein
MRQSSQQRQSDAESSLEARRRSIAHERDQQADAIEHAQQQVDHVARDDVMLDLHDKDEDCAQLFFCESSGFDIRRDQLEERYWQPVSDTDKLRSSMNLRE